MIKVNEMNAEKIWVTSFLSSACRKTGLRAKPWVSLMGVFLICASAQVAAQVCEAEFKALHADQPAAGYNTKSYYDEMIKNFFSGSSCTTVQQRLARTSEGYEEFRRSNPSRADEIARVGLNICILRARLAQCGSPQVSPIPLRNVEINRPSPTNPVGSNSPANVRPEAQGLNAQMRAADQLALNTATAYAQKRQADVDRARQGKPKRHIAGQEAHSCLRPDVGGGVTNACPYAVEYSYCVYRPTKDTWSASFECGKNGGNWQIGPGPNSRSVMHTAGEMTYWFACKYGETLSKPDGISPADIEYVAGRGLVGRCAQWGSARG